MPTIAQENLKTLREAIPVKIIIVGANRILQWDNDDILSWSATLRSVGTDFNPTLEASEFEAEIFTNEDLSDIANEIGTDTKVYLDIGYPGEVISRTFYLTEPIESDNGVITLKCADLTYFMPSEEVTLSQWNTDSGSTRYYFLVQLRNILLDEGFDIPISANNNANGTSGITISVLYQGNLRELIANAVNLYRQNGFYVNYRDAGIPTLTSDKFNNVWVITKDQIANLKRHVDPPIKSISSNVYNARGAEAKEITRLAVEANHEYEVESNSEIWKWYVTGEGTVDWSGGLRKITLLPHTSGTFVVSGEDLVKTYGVGSNPLTASSGESSGQDIDLGEKYSYVYAENGVGYSATKIGIIALLNRSPITYEFDYRGNPQIQPRDKADVEVGFWQDVTTGALYPANDLYPSEDLVPTDGTTERKLVFQTVRMTIDSVTLESVEGGGLKSHIIARQGEV